MTFSRTRTTRTRRLTMQMRTVIVCVMDMDSPETKQTAGTSRKPASLIAERRVASGELLGARGVLIIEHDGREYRLRVTRNRKLILTA